MKKCKHGKVEKTCDKCFEDRWGKVCSKCGNRHTILSTPGENLPKGVNSSCKG